jgi:hypothetical protein
MELGQQVEPPVPAMGAAAAPRRLPGHRTTRRSKTDRHLTLLVNKLLRSPYFSIPAHARGAQTDSLMMVPPMELAGQSDNTPVETTPTLAPR